VAVWVGNFDGHPTAGLSGANGAAPIVGAIISDLYRLGDPPSFERPEGVVQEAVCSFSGMRPLPACPQLRREWFIVGPTQECTFHREGEGHGLPASYAGWLHDRFMKGAEGRFRLEGFDSNLEKTFSVKKADGANEEPVQATLLTGPVTIAGDSAPRHLPVPGARGHSLSIVSPLDGDRYILDRPGSAITLRAAPEKPIGEVVWFVDGVEFASTPPPYSVKWPLARGRHTILAVGPDNTGGSVGIVVE
ncbi:MAG: hypothetical protein ACLGPL_00365, partial [Acidobacteriota bacterium]